MDRGFFGVEAAKSAGIPSSWDSPLTEQRNNLEEIFPGTRFQPEVEWTGIEGVNTEAHTLVYQPSIHSMRDYLNVRRDGIDDGFSELTMALTDRMRARFGLNMLVPDGVKIQLNPAIFMSYVFVWAHWPQYDWMIAALDNGRKNEGYSPTQVQHRLTSSSRYTELPLALGGLATLVMAIKPVFTPDRHFINLSGERVQLDGAYRCPRVCIHRAIEISDAGEAEVTKGVGTPTIYMPIPPFRGTGHDT